MKKKPTIAPTEQARREFLTRVKETQLDKTWTPERSELVDCIDEVLDAET